MNELKTKAALSAFESRAFQACSSPKAHERARTLFSCREQSLRVLRGPCGPVPGWPVDVGQLGDPSTPSLCKSILTPCSASCSAIPKNSFAPPNHNNFVSVSSVCPFDILEEIRSKSDVGKKVSISLVRGGLLWAPVSTPSWVKALPTQREQGSFSARERLFWGVSVSS